MVIIRKTREGEILNGKENKKKQGNNLNSISGNNSTKLLVPRNGNNEIELKKYITSYII